MIKYLFEFQKKEFSNFSIKKKEVGIDSSLVNPLKKTLKFDFYNFLKKSCALYFHICDQFIKKVIIN
jgi:hypothetical protein